MTQAAVENKTKLSKNLDDNLSLLDSKLAFDKNFDLIKREIMVGGRRAALIFVDAFVDAELMTLIQRNLSELGREDLSVDAFKKLFHQYINYVEVDTAEYLEDAAEKALSGPLVMIVDGSDRAIVIDVRTYPGRQPAEPDLEKVVRGSRDGFTETLVFNTALIRRRLRDPKLRMEYVQAGSRSKTDIVVCYIEDIANPELVNSIKEKLKNIYIDGLPMAEKAVEELITPGSYWNPFPRVRYTERPDVAAAHLLEGHVLVLVDTSPSVIIAPATFFHHVQHAEEYRQSPTIGIYLRWVRFAGILISVFLLPLWMLVVLHPELLPQNLEFIGPNKTGQVPIFLQFIIAEIAVDLVRMATIHTPTALATAVGLIATLLIGEIAVTVGLFNVEVIMYTATAAVGTFMTPSYELSMANRLARLVLLIVTFLFGLPGFIIGTALLIFWLAATKSFGIPYLWPLIPLNLKALGTILVRTPVPITNTRFSVFSPRDRDRQGRQGMPEPARKPVTKERRKR